MTNEDLRLVPAQDSAGAEWDPSVTYQTVIAGLYDPPDSDYFAATWEMPEPSIGVILRRGESWRPALLNAIREELTWWIDALEDSNLEENEARFGVVEPVPATAPIDGRPSLRIV